MHLVWILCRHDGRETHYLTDREPGGEVRVALNEGRTASVTAPNSQVERRRGGAAIHPGRSRIKVFAHAEVEDPDRVLVFNGEIASPSSDTDRIEIAALDQSDRLATASPAPLKEPGLGEMLMMEDEQSELIWRLIRHSNDRAVELQAEPGWETTPGLGIRRGTLADTGITRQIRVADGPSTLEIIDEQTSRNRAPDWELKPLDTRQEVDDDGAGEIHAELNTYWPRQGSVKDEVIFEDGHNCQVRHEPSIVDPPLHNRVVLTIGDAEEDGIAPCIVAENRASIRSHGVRQAPIESAGGEQDVDQVRKRAEGRVAARSRFANFFEITLPVAIGGQARGWAITAEGEILIDTADSFQVPPTILPGEHGDAWIGDVCTVRSKRFYFEADRGQRGPRTDYPVRILQASFRELDKAGNVGIELVCAAEAEEANAVISYRSEVFTHRNRRETEPEDG